MKKTKNIRKITRSTMHGFDGFSIISGDGELDRFYPAKVNQPESLGSAATVEVSEELFSYVAMLQNMDVQVIFSV